MKIYLAGPMRGIPQYNFPAFNLEAARLRTDGHTVFNPAEIDVNEDGFDPAKDEPRPFVEYMRRDLPAVMTSDVVAVLPGWRASKGARLEVHVATECDIPVVDAATLRPCTQENVLQEADRVVGGDRNDSYGHPWVDFTTIAKMWNAYIGKMIRSPRATDGGLAARDVANLMVLLKVAREAHGPKRDNLVDIAGYARCAERLDEPRGDDSAR